MAEIDFENIIKLPEAGSICDIYRTRWYRRDVFVKRLKEEFRSNPLYLDALEKEYDVGITFKHPSLPYYREFHRDYIVMDFIDGTTLSNMIKNNDPWLSNEKNIINMFKELVKVVDYLHRHNITHCDIKPDNIMITSNNHNIILIDFDKCYTDALNDTSGCPQNYGLSLSEKGKITIDFQGIGRVMKKLKEEISIFKFRKYKKFVNICMSPGCCEDQLMKILDYNPDSSKLLYRKFITTGIIIGILCILLFLYYGTERKTDQFNPINENQAHDTVIIKTAETIIPQTENQLKAEKDINKESESDLQRKLHKEAKKMAIALNVIIHPYFDELNLSLDTLESLSENPKTSAVQLLDSLLKLGEMEDEYCEETFVILNELFPGLTERESWRVMSYVESYTGYKQKSKLIFKKVYNKIEELSILNNNTY